MTAWKAAPQHSHSDPSLPVKGRTEGTAPTTSRSEHGLYITFVITTDPQRPQDQRRRARFHEWHLAALRPASRDRHPSVRGILAPLEEISRPADRGQSLTRERREEGQIRS
jgi:hypothetical protein